jgi:hypothetical protein
MADDRRAAYSKVAAAGSILAKSAPWVNVPQQNAVALHEIPDILQVGLAPKGAAVVDHPELPVLVDHTVSKVTGPLYSLRRGETDRMPRIRRGK